MAGALFVVMFWIPRAQIGRTFVDLEGADVEPVDYARKIRAGRKR
jgi:hypothetical protein